jgi:hypothetical protein
MTCSAAESSCGYSTSGGMCVAPSVRGNGPPSAFSKTQRALARFVVHQQQIVDFLQCARSARIRSIRRIRALPQRSGAESPIAPSIGAAAGV